MKKMILGLVVLSAFSCASSEDNAKGSVATSSAPLPAPSAEEAKAFVSKVDSDLRQLWTKQATAEWIKATHITDDSEKLAAWANEDVMAFLNRNIKDSLRFKNVSLDDSTSRQLHLLRLASALPAPADAGKRAELAGIAAKMDGMYGKGKWCGKGHTPGIDEAEDKKRCRDLQALSKTLATSTQYDELLDAWTGWHTISRDMRPMYSRMVELSNEGASEIGFTDMGDLWRSGYDMSPDAFEKETDRLWSQVKPLYEQVHCYVRSQLAKRYGANRVNTQGPIPAHLLGNMWAQEWANIYPLVEPYQGQPSLDVTAALVKKKVDPIQMVKMGESFFTSLGMNSLPESFWKNSMFVKPQDREVVCHASAWDVTFNNDLRIKMCIKIDEEDLTTIHHELGHIYYYNNYYKLPVLFQQGANDGFHEAIGDALTLSITPEYLKQVGLLNAVPKDDKGLINLQMKEALEKIAFLPFGRMMDQWRWDVFSGKVKPSEYNAHWWKLREKYQGLAAPVARSEADFDPGAKYHIPANVPYMRYFLARILQFQFHRAMCEAAKHQGPLHRCSIYGNKAAGEKLSAMLAMGSSKPWPDALHALTGQREMDASALVDYFQPLMTWLGEQNKGQSCGW